MRSILFVCTGNIFRSMIAEFALRSVLGAASDYAVSSAGTEAKPQQIAPVVRVQLLNRGIDPAGHRPRKLTYQMLVEADLAVAMGFDHRDYIKKHFDQEVILFNQICCGKEEPILDTWEAVPSWRTDPVAGEMYTRHVVDYIIDSMPYFVKNVEQLLA